LTLPIRGSWFRDIDTPRSYRSCTLLTPLTFVRFVNPNATHQEQMCSKRRRTFLHLSLSCDLMIVIMMDTSVELDQVASPWLWLGYRPSGWPGCPSICPFMLRRSHGSVGASLRSTQAAADRDRTGRASGRMLIRGVEGSVLMATSVPMVVAPGRSHGHCGSEHSHRRCDGLGRLEERQHRSDGALTASARDDRVTGTHLHDRGGHVAMGAAAPERARGGW
jgi:hypothetical protein